MFENLFIIIITKCTFEILTSGFILISVGALSVFVHGRIGFHVEDDSYRFIFFFDFSVV